MIAQKIKLFFAHCKIYHRWVRHNGNGALHKIYVFFRPRTSPTYMVLKVFDPIIKQVNKDLKGVTDSDNN